jgi:hypothetical protein
MGFRDSFAISWSDGVVLLPPTWDCANCAGLRYCRSVTSRCEPTCRKKPSWTSKRARPVRIQARCASSRQRSRWTSRRWQNTWPTRRSSLDATAFRIGLGVKLPCSCPRQSFPDRGEFRPLPAVAPPSNVGQTVIPSPSAHAEEVGGWSDITTYIAPPTASTTALATDTPFH